MTGYLGYWDLNTFSLNLEFLLGKIGELMIKIVLYSSGPKNFTPRFELILKRP